MDKLIKEISSLLKVDPISTDIYITLITHGDLNKKELAELLEHSTSEITTGLTTLLDQELIWEGTEQNTKLYSALSIAQLEEKLNHKRNTLKILKSFVIPKIQPENKLGVMKFEGWEGIRQAYIEVLAEAKKTKESILAIETNESNADIGEEFIENYISKRIKSKIDAKVICPASDDDRNYQNDHQGKYTQIRLHKDLNIEANINITGNLVMTFTINPPEGTLRRSSAEAKTIKSMFDVIWKETE